MENAVSTKPAQPNICRVWAALGLYFCVAAGAAVGTLAAVHRLYTVLCVACCSVFSLPVKRRWDKCNPVCVLLLGSSLWLPGMLLQSAVNPFWQVTGLIAGSTGAVLYGSGLYFLRPVMQQVRRFTGAVHKKKLHLGLNGCGFIGGLSLTLLFGEQGMVPFSSLCVVVTAITALQWPMDRRYIRKLEVYLVRTDAGEELPQRKAQLERMLVEKRRQFFLVKVLISLIRPFYPHTLQNIDRFVLDEDNPTIFLVNHGNLYGPVASFLFLPVAVRPWSISTICTDLQEGEDYIYKYDTSRMLWIPKGLRRPVARGIAMFGKWALESLEVIPVYRDHPTKLMQTFRKGVEAMLCGDSMLIFPENPNAAGQDHGYEIDRIGELFSGFAMLAPIYYNRTGRCARFMPVYCDQKHRTIRFGTDIVYRPGTNTTEERQRIADEAARQLNAMMHEG